MPDFKTAIRAATEGVIERLNTAYCNNEVYALVFYPTSGFGDIDVLYATKGWLSKQPAGEGPQPDEEMLELLKSHPDLLQQVKSHRTSEYYFEVNAYEWDSPISFFDLFTAANEILHDMEETDSIESILTEVLQDLRSSGKLDSDAFAEDVLLGVQFSDPSPNEVDLVTRISLAVNSAETHAKICDGYGIQVNIIHRFQQSISTQYINLIPMLLENEEIDQNKKMAILSENDKQLILDLAVNKIEIDDFYDRYSVNISDDHSHEYMIDALWFEKETAGIPVLVQRALGTLPQLDELDDASLRKRSVYAIAKIGGESAVEALKDLAECGSKQVRETAQKCIQDIQNDAKYLRF